METREFMDAVLRAAVKDGIAEAEVYCQGAESFTAEAIEGKIQSYEVSTARGMSLRGLWNGKMGYCATQAFDEEAITQLIRGVKESAELTETEEQDEIYAGDAEYPEMEMPESDIGEVTESEKIETCLKMEPVVLGYDKRITKSEGTQVSTEQNFVMIRNTKGLDLEARDSVGFMYTSALAEENDMRQSAGKIVWGRKWRELDPEKLARDAAEETVFMLGAKPVATGDYRVIIRNDAMGSLLATFSGIFSAENAQQKLSLLEGKEGTKIASDKVTILDDPARPEGMFRRNFDGEGTATKRKAVVEDGVLKTLLHSRKTAKKQGVAPTGNGFRAGYATPVKVAPTNLLIAPGVRSLEEMQKEMGDGLVITDVSGLHAGANPVSGDFSLLAKGYTVEDGQKAKPVEQITIAGNFYTLLQNIREVGNDLLFRAGPIGCPSADIGEIKVSGT